MKTIPRAHVDADIKTLLFQTHVVVAEESHSKNIRITLFIELML